MRLARLKEFIKQIDSSKREKVLFWAVNIFLFLLPFFWAGQKVYKIGGDDTRLYLFAPWQWLRNVAQYAWFTEMYSFGNYYPHFYNLPFNIIVGALKNIFFFLNHERVIYGLTTALAFSGMFLLITELIDSKKNKNSFYAGLAGGLLYVFAPIVYANFWPNPVSYFYDIAAFPLILYFFIRALNIKKIYPLILGAFVSVIFSISIMHPPIILPFFISSGIFLFLYALIVEQEKWLVIKYIGIYLFLFLLLNSFYLIPFVHSVFYGNAMSDLVQNLDSSEGMKSIIAILASYENLITNMSLIFHGAIINIADSGFWAQMYDYIFHQSHASLFLFLFVFLVIFFSKEKSSPVYKKLVIIIPSVLVALFLMTVNFDNWGVRLMSWLMANLPGFTALRNFYYKTVLVYAIFFSLSFGLACFIFLEQVKNKLIKFLVLFLAIFFIGGFSLPFILGRHFNLPINTSSGSIAFNVQLPPAYLEMLEYLKNKNEDNKVLSFPLILGSWSMVPSADLSGVYIGGPIVPALSGKTEFSSFMGFLQPHFTALPNVLLEAIKNNNVDFLGKMLGLMNIRYLHYNEALIKAAYADMDQIKKSFVWFGNAPEEQEKFERILGSLAEKDQSFGDFNLYKIKDENFLPHIYPSNNIVYFSGDLNMIGQIVAFRDYKKSDVLFYDRQIGREERKKAISSLAGKIYIMPYKVSEEIDKMNEQLYFFNDPVNHGLLLDKARALGKEVSLDNFELTIPQAGDYKILIKQDSALADLYNKNLKLCFNAICLKKERAETESNYFYAGNLPLAEQAYKIGITSNEKEIKTLVAGDMILEMTRTEKVETIPQIEFKKISPVKYQVSVRNAQEPFLLVFNELFNQQWKLYQGSGQQVGGLAKNYKTVQIQNSVQNQGLANGKFYETYFKNPLTESDHYLVNTFSNAWRVRPAELGSKNSAGGYDLNLVIEFYPQRIFIPSLAISVFSLLSCIIYLAYYVIRKNKI